MRFPFFRNRDSVKNGILISIRRTGDGFHPGLFRLPIFCKKNLTMKITDSIEPSYQKGDSIFFHTNSSFLFEYALLT